MHLIAEEEVVHLTAELVTTGGKGSGRGLEVNAANGDDTMCMCARKCFQGRLTYLCGLPAPGSALPISRPSFRRARRTKKIQLSSKSELYEYFSKISRI